MCYTIHMTDTRFLILGSAAAEGIPAFFCNCRVCREAAARGGREIRGRTSYNFGGVLQIDYGPDILQAFQRFHPRLNAMRHLLVTHAHEDHLAPAELWCRCNGFRRIPEGEPPLVIHGSNPVIQRINRDAAPTLTSMKGRSRLLPAMNVAFHEIAPFQIFELPDIGATVRTFAADHAPDLIPMIFIVTLGGRSVLIGNDTGPFPEETKEALRALRGKVHLDIAVLDCCGALLPNWNNSHMCADSDLATFAELEAWGLVDHATIKVVNHFSHNGNATHEDLCRFFEPKGIVVGYDGLEL